MSPLACADDVDRHVTWILPCSQLGPVLPNVLAGGEPTRPSRLFGSTWEYVKRSGATILRIYAMYEPFKVFILLGSALFGAGLALGLRYAWFWWHGRITGHFQSAILSVLLLILGFQTLQWGVMADLVASNRKLIEDLLYRVRKMELGDGERRG